MPTTPRPPVVAIVGHIDHGKSTLLDAIRKTNQTILEAGGITQRLAAYEISWKSSGTERLLTFLDTPGHEAFLAMRKRAIGAADIAVLVVAADDGVKPQTIETIEAIHEAKLPFMVAITKSDKPEANLDKVKGSLAEAGVYVEGYGGDVPMAAVSGKSSAGLPDLLDTLLLMADVATFTGDSAAQASGVVLESNRDKKRGIAATLVIKDGTLRRGQFVVAGRSMAPVRIFENALGKNIDEATFSAPAQIVGFDNVPEVGSHFRSFASRKEAEAAVGAKVVAGSAFVATAHDNEKLLLPIVIKTDVSGLGEAVARELRRHENERLAVKIMAEEIGAVSENDVKRVGTGGIVIGFHVPVEAEAKALAERYGSSIAVFDIIYELGDWFKTIVAERTPKVEHEVTRGSARVLRLFAATKDKQVIGAKAETGTLTVKDQVKILRRGNDIGRGRVVELRRLKQSADSINEGEEFGAMIESKLELATGDVLEAFALVVE